MSTKRNLGIGNGKMTLGNCWCLGNRLCGLVVRVPGYTTEMYCVSCEVRTEFMYVMYKKVDRLCGLVFRFLATDPVARVRFPALPDFMRSSGTGLSLVSIIEELLESKNSGSGLERREYGRRDPSC
jgi:hypothetical protein